MQEVAPIYSKFKNANLNEVQQTIVLLHSCNIFAELKPVISQSDMTECQIPPDWIKDTQGVYSFTYKMSNGKRVLFKFVQGDKKKSVGVNMVIEETGLLSQITIEVEMEDKLKVEKYMSFLDNKLKLKNKSSTNTQPRITSTVLDFSQRPERPERSERPILNPVPLPVGPNLGGGEYVGPDNQIFRGRLGSDPIDINRPYGSRYDPTDPFDNPLRIGGGRGGMGGQGIGGRGSDFFSGFDEFGRPTGGGGFGGFGPGNAGFGGGFGSGGSGGFGRWL